MRPKRSVKKETKVLIYCGPQLLNLQQHTIFKNDIPKYLEDDIKKCPAIKLLCVTPDNLAITRDNIHKQGTRENTLYNQINQYVRGE